MDKRNVAVVEDDSWNSARILGIPGANMEEPSGLGSVSYPRPGVSGGRRTHATTVMMDRTAMLVHFFSSGQFIGFSGSSGPSQETTSGSCFSSSSLPHVDLLSVSTVVGAASKTSLTRADGSAIVLCVAVKGTGSGLVVG